MTRFDDLDAANAEIRRLHVLLRERRRDYTKTLAELAAQLAGAESPPPHRRYIRCDLDQ